MSDAGGGLPGQVNRTRRSPVKADCEHLQARPRRSAGSRLAAPASCARLLLGVLGIPRRAGLDRSVSLAPSNLPVAARIPTNMTVPLPRCHSWPVGLAHCVRQRGGSWRDWRPARSASRAGTAVCGPRPPPRSRLDAPTAGSSGTRSSTTVSAAFRSRSPTARCATRRSCMTAGSAAGR